MAKTAISITALMEYPQLCGGGCGAQSTRYPGSAFGLWAGSRCVTGGFKEKAGKDIGAFFAYVKAIEQEFDICPSASGQPSGGESVPREP